jgi:hypothetical protein
MTPVAMKKHLTKMKVLDQYDVARPKPRPTLKVASDYTLVAEILNDSTGFVAPYAERVERVINGNGYVVHYSPFWWCTQGSGSVSTLFKEMRSKTKLLKY